MMRHPVLRGWAARVVVSGSIWTLAFPMLVAASEPAGQDAAAGPRAGYRQALARERALRTPSPVPMALADYRAAVATYRAITDQFPTSAYGDRALWQAAGLCLVAFEQAHDHLDRDTGIALLHQLRRDYPDGSLTVRAPERIDRFDALETHRWITDLHRDVLGQITRVTLEFDDEVAFESERLANPPRLFFDVRDTEITPAVVQHATTLADAVVGAVRFDRRPNDLTRIVIDTAGAETCHILTLYEPFRIVTDCRAAQPAAVSPAAAPDAPAVPTTLSRQLGLGISRIVIDPGHGGRDPGAIGHGLEESALVLDIAHRVANRLARYGIETVMTRRADRYLPLEARTTLANRVNADLFLSIHANAGGQPETRGIETYVLDFATSREAAAVATRENAEASGTMVDLDAFVRAIGASAKAAESRALAELVQQRLVDKLRTVDPGIPDLGVKEAPFVVLIGARVPSVLAEISFLSNSRDAHLLRTDTYRDLVADGLVEAVLGYRRVLKPVQVQTDGISPSIEIRHRGRFPQTPWLPR